MQHSAMSAGTATGIATGIGSLPHTGARDAAEFTLGTPPELPAVPQLPGRHPWEQMIAQWVRGVPGVEVRPDGAVIVADADAAADSDRRVDPAFDPDAHGGLLTFVEVATARDDVPSRVKAQVTGPLTLGRALVDAGLPAAVAYRRGAEAAAAWAGAVESLVGDRLPGAELVVFFDEPALVELVDDDPPIEREEAVDLLSRVLSIPRCVTGVHVCGDGDLRVALEAGPAILAVEASPSLTDHAVAIGRHLEGGGWVAWGAVPTDRPVGESSEPLWRRLVDLWCELTRRGCDAIRLRTHALVTPACGLAGHGPSQAQRALRLAREIGYRVRGQAVATRLSVGA